MANRHERLRNYQPWGLAWNVGLELPSTATEPGQRFFDTWARTNSLMAFVFGTTAKLARVAEDARQVLDKAGVERSSPPPGSDAFTVLGAHTQILWEMLLCRHVDNFLSYLSGVLFDVFIARPEMLKSNGQIDIETVLAQSSIKDVVHILAERKVNELSYKSFKDLCAYFAKQGFAIGTDDDRSRITRAIGVRNISVHNGCVINSRFVETVPGTSPGSVGQFLWLDINDVEPLAIVLGDLVKELDAQANSHFKLPMWPMTIDPLKHPLADEPPPVSDDG